MRAIPNMQTWRQRALNNRSPDLTTKVMRAAAQLKDLETANHPMLTMPQLRRIAPQTGLPAPQLSEAETQAMQRAFVKLIALWEITDEQAAVLMGDISVRTWRRWKVGGLGRAGIDVAARLSNLMGIHKALRLLFKEPDYTASQAFAREEKAVGSEGIVYPSVRNPGGLCFAAFYPDVMSPPVQGRHLSYHWNGALIDMFKDLTSSAVYAITP